MCLLSLHQTHLEPRYFSTHERYMNCAFYEEQTLIWLISPLLSQPSLSANSLLFLLVFKDGMKRH